MQSFPTAISKSRLLFSPPSNLRLRSIEHSICLFIGCLSLKYLWKLISAGRTPFFKLFGGFIFGSLKGELFFLQELIYKHF